jgi:ATP-dependent helicase/nuclease subunit A
VSGRHIPADLARVQIAASDPRGSAWVSANAGSGKTFVLVQRVIRLLLDGVDPAKILCLTFTKAAAANMATRVFDTLRGWTALDDAELDAEIAKIDDRRAGPERRLRARQLFAEALETPGGLKVQTIHAFCTSLLHQFPFEANVAARFEVLEERAVAELVDQIRMDVLLRASAEPQSALGRALAAVIVAATDTTVTDVLREAIAERDAVEGWIASAGGIAGAVKELSDRLSVDPRDTQERVEAEFFDRAIIPRSEWPALSAAFEQGSKSDRDNIPRLAQAAAGQNWANILSYLQVFCTKDFDPRKSVATATIKRDHPELFERLVQEQDRVCALLRRRRAVMTRDRTAALLTLADAILKRYRAEKERRGLLDYDDLIDKTLSLLSADGAPSWVMYKLDLGIDHVLIDEAQDTSPKQWEVVRRLTAEFMAGRGARENVRRSVFAVGDEKQSIFSFQGAAPYRFDEERRFYQRACEAAGLPFHSIPFRYSFRSAPDILHAVDTVFGREQAYSGLSADPVPTVHEAVRRHAPGCIDIWNLLEPDPRAQTEAWDAPFDTTSGHSPQVRLARRIANNIRDAIRTREIVGDGDKRRPARPGDFLVLVRHRGSLFEAIIRALKEVEVEVAGADRLILTEHIAVMDLLSLTDALLLPENDLALAEALKSPLLGLNEDDLFALAHGRRRTLRGALRTKAAEIARFAAVAEMLDALAREAMEQTPFEFYARLLGARGGRRKILARLGPEANDALDEFLALALEYERRHTPTLQGFVGWMRSAPAEVKRDMDIVRDEVRVMTVHGAKGLEAPVVILADTVTRPAGPRDPRLLSLDEHAGRDPEPTPMVWAGLMGDDVEPVRAARMLARQANEEEHRRLLYVAMTRAEDRLIVCGARGVNEPSEGCWYRLVDDALRPLATLVSPEADSDQVFRITKSQPEPGVAQLAMTLAAPAASTPDWLRRDAAAQPARRSWVAPSRTSDGEDTRRTRVPAGMPDARLRGRLIHRLLQSLPDVAPAQRREIADRFLARASALTDEQRAWLIAQAETVLNEPVFAPLFAAGSRAEVPVVGQLRVHGENVTVSGQIDRLAVTPEGVLIADFKSEHTPPQRLQDVPSGYRRQLAEYRAVLAQVFPGRTIRAALVWTASPALMEIPASLLDAALAECKVSAA